MKRTFKIVGIVVAVLIVILIALPFFIDVNSFRPKLEATASEAVGRQVKVGNLSLSILSGSVSADNISIAEDPAFGNTPFVTAKSLKVGVELMPLHYVQRTACNRHHAGAAADHAAEDGRWQVEFFEPGRESQ